MADHSLRIDMAWMIRHGFAVPGGWRGGRLAWSWGGEPHGSTGYTCDMTDPEAGELVLRFTCGAARGDPKDQVQCIRLSYTVPHLGGRRWWMHCPINGERVGKLYIPPGGDIFASRKAWRLGYQSQRIAGRDRSLKALYRLERRLGYLQG